MNHNQHIKRQKFEYLNPLTYFKCKHKSLSTWYISVNTSTDNEWMYLEISPNDLKKDFLNIIF